MSSYTGGLGRLTAAGVVVSGAMLRVSVRVPLDMLERYRVTQGPAGAGAGACADSSSSGSGGSGSSGSRDGIWMRGGAGGTGIGGGWMGCMAVWWPS
jgi:hypothetical protein